MPSAAAWMWELPSDGSGPISTSRDPDQQIMIRAQSHASRLLWFGFAALIAAYFLTFWLAPKQPETWPALWFVPGVGVIGAIIANASGTGGGVVFIPVFNALRDLSDWQLDPLRVTAISMGIQAFGMSVGALRWTDRLLHQPAVQAHSNEAPVRYQDYAVTCMLVLAISLPVQLLAQAMIEIDGTTVLIAYKGFSVILGTALIIATWTVNRDAPERAALTRFDWAVLAMLSVPGGFVTALFSVGIGELVAFYLFLRHFPMLLAVGTACVISSISMIAGTLLNQQAGIIAWDIVLLAAPGAMIGAVLARPIALWLGPRKLKTAGGLWIAVSALYLIGIAQN
ncbi:sulfite exporter TauE/SafE family protein [Erythrobacter insulae]|uniref:Probable membrane transporter protein n=1 Tax=Erythrobacter insulae TaxID=2584124 RepID=A0A547PCE4_9SPHN|nr:sulfite exporter TauE/SafE family protein [Erythrobacter insulae]TRD11819.1 sulfite exporter TauE/SafE family protein [Erythrobacter insulae]